MRLKDAGALSSRLVSMAAIALAAGCGSAADGSGNPNGAPDGGGVGNPVGGDAGISLPPVTGGDAGGPLGGDAGSPAPDSGAGDAGAVGDAGPFVPAPHPPFPLLVNSGGAVLTKPVMQPIFFSNYDITAQVTKMVEGLPTATLLSGVPFWSGATSEYGVGPLTVLPPINLTEAAPTTDTDPVAFLQGKLSDPAFKNVTPSTVLALFYPSTTPLGGSCAAQTPGYGGYHDSFTNGANQQPFAVMSECANYGPLKTALDMVTVAGSHEMIEAATDPHPSAPAFTGLDQSGAGFDMGVFLQGNAENGDLCAINAGFGRGPASYPFLLSRGWSNKAAKAGNLDPCAPDLLPEQPFVGAYPVLPDTVSDGSGGSGPGVVIPVGQSKTIEVDLFTFEPTADFTVLARQSSQVKPPTLTFAWDKTTGKNGDKLHLTITSVTGSPGGVEAFVLQTSLSGVADAQKPAWAGVVTHQ